MALEGQSEVRLSYMQNNFSVTFNIQNYALADQVEYAYMLKGLENSWYTVTDPNNVTFRNIPPGNYCFQVKTRIRNQEWADEIALWISVLTRLYGLRGGPSYFIFFRVFLSCILFFMPIKRNWIWSLSMSWRRKIMSRNRS